MARALLTVSSFATSAQGCSSSDPGCVRSGQSSRRRAGFIEAMSYILKRSAAFARFLDDGRNCLFNTAAERVIKCPIHKATKLKRDAQKKQTGGHARKTINVTNSKVAVVCAFGCDHGHLGR
jgi:hypothetical protein